MNYLTINNKYSLNIYLFTVLFTFPLVLFSAPAATTAGGALPRFNNIESENSSDINIDNKLEKQKQLESKVNAPRIIVKQFNIEGVREDINRSIAQPIIEKLVKNEVKKISGHALPASLNLEQFEQVADAITRYYRLQGFFLARAFIPEQTVRDGEIKIQVVESQLDRVVVDGNELYKDDLLVQPFSSLIGRAIYKDEIESALYHLVGFPGLQIKSIFGPGSKPGTAALLLRVKEEAVKGQLSLDNYGSVFTGENRLRLYYQFNNPWGKADSLSSNIMATLSPQNNIYADVNYTLPFINQNYRFNTGLMINQFKVGEELEALGITGDSSNIYAGMDYKFLHTADQYMNAGFDFNLKQAKSKQIDSTVGEDKLSVLRLKMHYQKNNAWWAPSKQVISSSVSIGIADFLGSLTRNGMDASGTGISSRQGGSEEFAGGGFSKLNIDYLYNHQFNSIQNLLLRFSGQYTSDLLTSLEQFPLGGADTVRAYPSAEILVDSASFVSLEWVASASPDVKYTWLNKLKLSAFIDLASGKVIDPLVNEKASVFMGGIGLGMQLEPLKKFKARIDLSLTELGERVSDNQTLAFYLRLEYTL